MKKNIFTKNYIIWGTLYHVVGNTVLAASRDGIGVRDASVVYLRCVTEKLFKSEFVLINY